MPGGAGVPGSPVGGVSLARGARPRGPWSRRCPAPLRRGALTALPPEIRRSFLEGFEMRMRNATALALATVLAGGMARAQDQEETRLSPALEQLRETVSDRLRRRPTGWA